MVWICSPNLSSDVTLPFQQMSPAPTARLARSAMLKPAGACAPKGVWKHGSPCAAATGWRMTTNASWTWKPALSSWSSEWWPMENAVSTEKQQSVHPSPSYMVTHPSAFAAKNIFWSIFVLISGKTFTFLKYCIVSVLFMHKSLFLFMLWLRKNYLTF